MNSICSEGSNQPRRWPFCFSMFVVFGALFSTGLLAQSVVGVDLPDPNPTTSETFRFEVDFDTPVMGVDALDFATTGTIAGTQIDSVENGLGQSLRFLPTLPSRVVTSGVSGIAGTECTIEAWVRVLTQNTVAFFSYVEPGGSVGFRLDYNGSSSPFPPTLFFNVPGLGSLIGANLNDFAWHHVAIDWRSSDGQTRVHLDGSLITTKTATPGATLSDGGTLVLGDSQSPSSPLNHNGFIDELRIWNYRRTTAEIQADLGRRLNGDEPGLRLYYPFNAAQDLGVGAPGLNDTEDASINSNHGDLESTVSLPGPPFSTSWMVTASRPSMMVSGQIGLDVLDNGSITSWTGGALTGPFSGANSYQVIAGPPEITSAVNLDISPNSGPELHFQVDFNEPVSGVDATDFALATTLTNVVITEVASIQPGPLATSWEITICVLDPGQAGDIDLDVLNDGSIVDADGSALASGLTAVATYTLDGTGSNTLVVPTDHASIQAAINAAPVTCGTRIEVLPGTYVEHDINFLGKPLEVVGVMGADLTIIEANLQGRGFILNSNEPSSVKIEGLTIRNGRCPFDEPGGGIFIDTGSAATILNCKIEDCRCRNAFGSDSPPASERSGGGLFGSATTSLTIRGCTFDSNQAGPGYTLFTQSFFGPSSFTDGGHGGGAFLLGPSVVEDCVFINNSAGDGARIDGFFAVVALGEAGQGGGLAGAALQVRRCRFESNSAGSRDTSFLNATLSSSAPSSERFANGGRGGGAHLSSSSQISDCLFVGNTGGLGVVIDGASAPISAVRGGDGAGLFLIDSNAVNCSFAGNTTGNSVAFSNDLALGGNGGGLAGENSSATNCIAWGNTLGSGPNGPGSDPGMSGSLTVTNCIVEGGIAGTNVVDADPLFLDSANGDYRIDGNSLGFNAGDAALYAAAVPAVNTDLDGNARIQGQSIDLGPYEWAMGRYLGSGEDFITNFRLNGMNDSREAITVVGGDLLDIRMLSPEGGFNGSELLLLGQVFPTGTLLLTPVGFPEVHVDITPFAPSGVVVLYGDNLFFGPPVLNPLGNAISFNMPPVAAGTSAIVQGLVLSNQAQNGFFAAADAREIVFTGP